MANALTLNADGNLDRYSSVGGYPLFYLDARDNVLCAGCARDALKSQTEEPPVVCGINWEDSYLECDECGCRIESAYGEPDA